jgi:hypothetical protein
MTLPSSGRISSSQIQNEFGGSNPISISQYYGLDSGVPSSGPIKFSDFYGKIINATRDIGSTQNFNAANDFVYYATVVGGKKTASNVYYNNQPVKYYISVNGVVGATDTGSYAFDMGAFPSGTQIYLTNNNYIVGAGGGGGGGSGESAGGAGGAGGPALILRNDTFITNNGVIAGGGGGGGGGGYGYSNGCLQDGCCHQTCWTVFATGGGGGGGAGYNAGGGGGGGAGGASGSLTGGGSGGDGYTNTGGNQNAISGSGGSGGSLGSSGGDGAGGYGAGSQTDGGAGGAGGAAGNYITNGGYATWLTTGTLLGGAA